jgi:peptidoglycan LD-endopeptidase CwlK
MANESSNLFVLISALAYFLLAIAVGAVLLFPREALEAARAVARGWSRMSQRMMTPLGRARQGVGEFGERGSESAGFWWRVAQRNRWLLLASAVLVLIPVVLALSLQRYVGIGGFEDNRQPTDPVILALLQGEHLVPPAPLPPEVFTTREVELIRPALGSASRDWNRLDAEFRQRLLAVFEVMKRYGYEMALLEGYRSPERQDYLAGLGAHVTSAAAYQSYHQYGLAADCAFFLNGRLIIDEKDPWAMQGYRLYGEAAEAAGLGWGGRWKMMDFGHVELRRPGTLSRAK